MDVLRRRSLPKICTVPSANGKMKFPLLSGVNTSFALSLLAWSSDASHLLHFFNVCDRGFSFPDSSRVQCETYLARLLSRTDAVATGLLQRLGDIRPSLQTVSLITRFTSFTENFVISCYQVTNIFFSRYGCASAFSAKSPRFLSSNRYRNLGVSESACGYCACPNPVPLLLATPLVTHEKELAVSRSLGAKFPRGFAGLLSSTKFSLKS